MAETTDMQTGEIRQSERHDPLSQVYRGIRHHLMTGLTYRETSKDPKGNGYTFAEVPDWQLRDWLTAIEASIPGDTA